MAHFAPVPSLQEIYDGTKTTHRFKKRTASGILGIRSKRFLPPQNPEKNAIESALFGISQH